MSVCEMKCPNGVQLLLRSKSDLNHFLKIQKQRVARPAVFVYEGEGSSIAEVAY